MKKIVSTPGTCGGERRFDGTRLTVELIIGYAMNGRSDKDILENYPGLDIDDVEYVRSLIQRKNKGAINEFAKRDG